MTQFVSLVQQGSVVNQQALAVSPDQEMILAQAERYADDLNARGNGRSGWSAVVLPIGETP